MRRFIVIGHEAPVTPEFSLDDLAGGAGRLDVLCRCVNAAFMLSHAIREDVELSLVLQDEYTVTFTGSELRHLYPDERSAASLIRGALEHRENAIGHMPVESSPGVSIARYGLETVLENASADGTVIQLHENGDPIGDVEPPEHPVFMLSDHRDFTNRETELVAAISERQVRLGPTVLHADHSMIVAHHYLDTDGWTRF